MKMNFKSNLTIYSVVCSLFLGVSCVKEKNPELKADFDLIVNNSKSIVPTQIKVTDKSIGANTYLWNFIGGKPDSANTKNPPLIQYTKAGKYTVKLTIINKFNQSNTFQKEIVLDDSILIALKFINPLSMHTPVDYTINNSTKGMKKHAWVIEDGTPLTSTDPAPNIHFTTPGKHKISYTASNDVITYNFDTTITVMGDIVNNFVLNWLPIDNDMEVPFILNVNNTSSNAFQYTWKIMSDNATTIYTSTDTNISYSFANAGIYTISLTATNDKNSITKSKQITLLPNSNVYRLNDLKFGIYTPQQKSIGTFFSVSKQAVIIPDSLNKINSENIDIGFYSFDNTFQTCQFFSPSVVNTFYSTLNFTNAKVNTIINRPDLCQCLLFGVKISDFDNIYDDTNLKQLTINSSDNSTPNFNINSLPYLVFFKTSDNRKGIIKVKQFVNNGSQSYIIVDLKMMKNP